MGKSTERLSEGRLFRVRKRLTVEVGQTEEVKNTGISWRWVIAGALLGVVVGCVGNEMLR